MVSSRQPDPDAVPTAAERRLLHLLADDASRLEPVADALGCELEQVHRELDALRARGLVTGVQARVAPARVGLPITAFYLLQVAQNAETYEAVAALIRGIDQVEEAHAVSGRHDWLVKVRARDVADLQRLLTEQLALLPGFVRAESMVVHSTAVDEVNVPAALYPLGA